LHDSSDFFVIDMHVHSFCSDGLHSPDALVKYAKRKGLNGIAIVDHAPKVDIDVIVKRRFKLYKHAFDMNDFVVLPGIEFSFPEGHLLAIFPDFDCDFSFGEVSCIGDLYGVVKDFDGLLIAAHIYRRSGLRDKVLKYIDYLDALEVYPPSRRFNFAKELNIPRVAGSDSHTSLTLGFAVTVFRNQPTSIYDVLKLIKSGEVYPLFFKPYFLRRVLDCFRWFSPTYIFKRADVC